MKDILKISAVTVAIAGIIGLSGCGGGSSGSSRGDGSTGSSLTATGVVTGFGSRCDHAPRIISRFMPITINNSQQTTTINTTR